MATESKPTIQGEPDSIYTPPLPNSVRINPIRDQSDWQAMRDACASDTGAFHARIAASQVHWFHPDRNGWLTRNKNAHWSGWHAISGEQISCEHWTPWEQALDEADAPFYRWFVGAKTNAAFNEVDRHVLAGYGDEVAFFYEGDRWDPAANDGRGAPVHRRSLTRRELFIQSVVCAQALQDLGLKAGDRIALNMPNILEQIVWTEAAKRIGVIYTPVFGGFSDKTLSDRIEDAGARIVVTADGASRNAEIVPFKEVYTDPALDRFIGLPTALDVVSQANLPAHLKELIITGVRGCLKEEITVSPADVMREVGRILDDSGDLGTREAAKLRANLAEALTAATRGVEKVIVVRHAHLVDVPWTDGRDVWAEELIKSAEHKVCRTAEVKDMTELRALPDTKLVPKLWRSVPTIPVAADFPLFIIYTSGSTGKPKGVVHVHGGYVAGLVYTMKISFDATPDNDVVYVVADPGWITGQSYLITASLATRIPSIVTEGAPVFPNTGRFASIIERYRVTIFKAGVTFLKTVMTNPQNRADVEKYDRSTLKVATFCAEPTSPAVQQFGMELMTPQYINSYWATEHGGIVWTHPYGNPDQRVRSDAHTYPLPWIFGDVWIAEGKADKDGRQLARIAQVGEKGEIVITRPYPYLARTIWGDADNVGSRQWKGDIERFNKTYFSRFHDEQGQPVRAYVQGDFARCYSDGSFSLHGRSDDVINVSGHRIGTEEIEGAILKDKQLNPDSPVGNCIVVGAPHRDKGLTPVAFVVPVGGRLLSLDDERRLKDLVRNEKGAVAIPSDFIQLAAFPETRSGKYMRRFLKAMMLDDPLGDTSTLRNPECLEEIKQRINQWKHVQARSDTQTIIEQSRFVRTQFDTIVDDEHKDVLRVATVTINNPPVNALSERVLDELDTQLMHIERQPDIRAVVITGAGNRSFVAGADIRQLLEELQDIDAARALATKAHAVFRQIEHMTRPVIAAIQGVALGGGFELAMACHYRVGDARTRLGQPEINLFLPPGYGGTQRLPRLLIRQNVEDGLREALRILLSGRQIDGQVASRLGLIDCLAGGAEDPLTLAQLAARAAVLNGDDHPVNWSMIQRQNLVKEWNRPAVWPGSVERDDYVEMCRSQAELVGRGPVAAAIMKLVRTGFEQGFHAGLAAEVETFAQFILDEEHGGKRGIRLFLDKQSPPLAVRPHPKFTDKDIERLISAGELLPIGAALYSGVTPLPKWQYAQAVIRDRLTGAYRHGDPEQAEVQEIIPVPQPGPNQALVYVLASEVNYNDIWAITGIPVSLFDEHDEDVHVTGSGGVGMVVQLGENLQIEGRLTLGSLVGIYSGVSDLLHPEAGNDPMHTDFHIQGYQSPDGSHQQFMLADGPQLHPVPPGLTLSQAASYILTAGTVYRALYTTLEIRPRSRLFVEGAATGTGAWAVEMGLASRCRVTGLVSSSERKAAIESRGAYGVDRHDPAFSSCFTPVPAKPSLWQSWAKAGRPFVDAVRQSSGGELCDYAISHAGEKAFARTFQILREGGTLTFFGASSGYHMTFLGKAGSCAGSEMLRRAAFRAGEAVVVFYGTRGYGRDDDAILSIESARSAGARIVVVTDEDAERDFVLSLGFGDAVLGAVSLSELQRRVPNFIWPDTMPSLPNPQRETDAFKEAVRLFTENTFKPLGAAVGRLLRSADNPRGMPDLIFERAHCDSLAVSTMLVKPNTGRVVYTGDMEGRRYSFYAPQVWMRQRRIYMPNAAIFGTHLSNAAEIVGLNRMINAGAVQVAEPYMADWEALPTVHQAMWENRLPEHTGGTSDAIVNHALPEARLKSRDELLTAWAASSKRH